MSFTNESGVDRILRIVVSLLILGLGWSGVVMGGFGLTLKIIGFIPLLTGLFGFCPLYWIFKIHTNKA